MNNKYHLKYNFTFETSEEGFSKEDIKKDNAGGTDALLMCSILKNGSSSFDWVSIDPQQESGTLSTHDIFHAFNCLGLSLSEDDNLFEKYRNIISEMLEKISEEIRCLE